jgi:hypothetical protein
LQGTPERRVAWITHRTKINPKVNAPNA